MKIELLTIWHEMNYGAELQAYATVKMLQQLGHQVEMINIQLADCHVSNVRGKLANMVSFFGPVSKKYNSFWNKHIPVTRRYHTIDEIQSMPPKGDVYMVGSDQVWNPELTGDFAKLFFLDFGDNNVRRISYASSFGTSEWMAPELTEDVRSLLQRFDHISCRELSGVRILKETFEKESTLVLDPTLLFKNYRELTGSLNQQKSLVFYPLYDDPELGEYASVLAERLHLKLVNNKKTTTVLGKITWDRVGIEEWVKNIAESQFVLTRSFHGLVFSLLYKKPFAIIANRNNRGTRVLNLLEQLGLSDRYYRSFEDCDNAQPWNKVIDYDAVHAKIELLRTKSIDYLKNALK